MKNTITTTQLFNLLTKNTNNNSLSYLDKLLNKTFTSIPEEYYNDAEEFIINFLQNIINTSTHLDIISLQIGEILQTINLQEYGGEEILSSFSDTNTDILIYGEIDSWNMDIDEWIKARDREFNGFFSTDAGQTHVNRDGIRVHKPPFSGFWAGRGSGIVAAEFRTVDGKTTDQFVGSCNDFNNWFNAKCCRNEKFNVYALNKNYELVRVARVRTWIGPKNTYEPWQNPYIVQTLSGEWKIEEA